MSVTIKDVAKEAGVSTATVSYVINKKKKLNPETENKVLEAVKKLGYRPNLSARSLAGQRTDLLGIIIPYTMIPDESKSLRLDNPFYGDLFNGIEKEARQNNYDIIIIRSSVCDTIKDTIRQRNLDGIIIVGALTELAISLEEIGIPMVLIDGYCEGFYNIGIDDEYGGYIATKHLLKLGHEEIGLIGHGVGSERFNGYKRALNEWNISVKKENIYTASSSMDEGYEGIENLLNQNQNITAIFSTADVISMGIYKKLNELNIKIPDDISIVSFDNFSYTEFLHPSLTTINQPISLKGKKAAEILIKLILGKNVRNKDVRLPIELVKRNSTARLV